MKSSATELQRLRTYAQVRKAFLVHFEPTKRYGDWVRWADVVAMVSKELGRTDVASRRWSRALRAVAAAMGVAVVRLDGVTTARGLVPRDGYREGMEGPVRRIKEQRRKEANGEA